MRGAVIIGTLVPQLTIIATGILKIKYEQRSPGGFGAQIVSSQNNVNDVLSR